YRSAWRFALSSRKQVKNHKTILNHISFPSLIVGWYAQSKGGAVAEPPLKTIGVYNDQKEI
ncbi:MAG: hypothetical protein IJI36_10430, partial [Kiritimatiellae bacterium]|nr:hypothetical protein [Kiritimatiellia bacterium]